MDSNNRWSDHAKNGTDNNMSDDCKTTIDSQNDKNIILYKHHPNRNGISNSNGHQKLSEVDGVAIENTSNKTDNTDNHRLVTKSLDRVMATSIVASTNDIPLSSSVEKRRVSITSHRKGSRQSQQLGQQEQQQEPQYEENQQQESYHEEQKQRRDGVNSEDASATAVEKVSPTSVAFRSSIQQEQPPRQQHQQAPYQDYSTFAWTKAMMNNTKVIIKNQSNKTEAVYDHNGRVARKATPLSCIKGPLHDRYASAPSASYVNGIGEKWRGGSSTSSRRHDFILSSESSSLFAKNKQPHFLFVPPNMDPNLQKDTYIRLDAYSNGVSSNGTGGAGNISLSALDYQEQVRVRHQRLLLKRRIRSAALIGAFVGGLFAFLLLFVFPHVPDDMISLWNDLVDRLIDSRSSKISSERASFYHTPIPLTTKTTPKESSILPQIYPEPVQPKQLKYHYPASFSLQQRGIRPYICDQLIESGRWLWQSLFNYQSSNSTNASSTNQRQRPIRTLASSESSTSSSSSSKSSSNTSPLLVIAGKMTVAGGPCNIAQYNLDTGEWSLDERIQLSLYNSYSGGEVYSLLANYTATPIVTDSNNDDTISSTTTRQPIGRSSTSSSSTSNKRQAGSGDLIVVGAFDTTYRNSQVTYCSVGMWDGSQLSKVGEGLCNSALSKGMKITTASLAGPQDVYVAGSFQTQVWSGDRNEFVKIFNIAHFNAVEQVWLPLNVGQISCSWCTVTVLALAWDSKRRQLHVAGKFNAIDGRNVPAGLAIYDYDSGTLQAHPGGGLSMKNSSQDGVGTALQLDEDSGVLYVMGSFERLTQTYEICDGLAAYEIQSNRWTCIADPAHTVYPTGGGNMLLTPFGLMVAGKTTPTTTWHNANRPYTIALLKATLKTRLTPQQQPPSPPLQSINYNKNFTKEDISSDQRKVLNATASITNITNGTASIEQQEQKYHDFNWSWLPGFKGHDEPLHALTNGFGGFERSVFVAGDNFVARWSYQSPGKYPEDAEDENSTKTPVNSSDTNNTVNPFSFNDFGNDREVGDKSDEHFFDEPPESSEIDTLFENDGQTRRLAVIDSRNSGSMTTTFSPPDPPKLVPVTEILSSDNVRGAIMAISQMMPSVPDEVEDEQPILPPGATYNPVNITIIVYCVTVGCIIGVIGAILCNRNITGAIFPFNNQEKDFKGFSLDTLTYSAMENTSIMDAYQRAMKTRYVHHPNLLTIIDPQEIFLQRIIGEGTFGRVWSARWRTASVAVKEFVFAQAAVAGKSSQQQQIVEEIIGEAGMMAILRHPNVLQLFGCSLTAQAIWIVSELCSLGSLRQLLDDNDRVLPVGLRLSLALQVAEGMTYLHNQTPPIIHRDLKSHNIFVHETFTEFSEDSCSFSSKRKDGSEKIETHSTVVARIGDWGSARASLSGSRTMTHGVGTACWLAPEVIKHARSSKFSDVYGYGIVLWELATREEVYQGLETTQIIAKVANENLRPPVPKDCPWKDIMVKCWAENPQDRLEFHDILAELTDLSQRLQESTMSSNNKGGSNSSVN
jgi:Protein tyrosine and serine/threonine kinase